MIMAMIMPLPAAVKMSCTCDPVQYLQNESSNSQSKHCEQ